MPIRIAKDFFLHKDANQLWFNANGEAVKIKSGLRQWVRKGRDMGSINFTNAELKSQCDAEISWEKARQQSRPAVIATTPPEKKLTWEQRRYRKQKEAAAGGSQPPMTGTPETISPAPAQPEPPKPMTDEQRQQCVTELRQLQGKI